MQTNLIALRQKAGYSQSQEAQLLGVSSRSIQNYETGGTYPSFTSLEKLLEVYHLPAEDFFFKNLGDLPAAAPAERKPTETTNIPPKKPFNFKKVWNYC